MFRVSTLLAVLAVIGTVAEIQAQQIVSRNESSTVPSASKASQNLAPATPKVSPVLEITDYPKYPIEYPADWKGPRVAGPQLSQAAITKTAAMTTAFRKSSNSTKALSISSTSKTANNASTNRVIGNQPTQTAQPRIISPTYNRYPSFYAPSACLTGR